MLDNTLGIMLAGIKIQETSSLPHTFKGEVVHAIMLTDDTAVVSEHFMSLLRSDDQEALKSVQIIVLKDPEEEKRKEAVMEASKNFKAAKFSGSVQTENDSVYLENASTYVAREEDENS